jgi:hypothetical protein
VVVSPTGRGNGPLARGGILTISGHARFSTLNPAGCGVSPTRWGECVIRIYVCVVRRKRKRPLAAQGLGRPGGYDDIMTVIQHGRTCYLLNSLPG